MILGIFIILRLVQHLIERGLASLNKRYYEDNSNRNQAAKVLNIKEEEMEKALSYSRDKYSYGSIESWCSIAIVLAFLGLGGLGFFEGWAKTITASLGMDSRIVVGLVFFGLIGISNMIVSLPFEVYYTFVLEDKHGFNRQTPKGFILDHIKGVILGSILGGALLALILYIMEVMVEATPYWWAIPWLVMFGFSLLITWIYPTLLAPLFNKFSPIEEGELKDKIFKLAQKVSFNAGSVSIMDASKRSTHGNAYFTGTFGKKKIVLFDNLLKSMNVDEIIAILAHELGHFKLNHVRLRLIQGFFLSGVMFYLLSLCLPLESFYRAFSMDGVSYYGALVVFSLWFGPISFLMQPLGNYISRRHEFAADKFAIENGDDKNKLGDALLKLRETSNVMPITHPLFSAVYLSHPPILERLQAMGYIADSKG